jgi:hypothetical protein
LRVAQYLTFVCFVMFFAGVTGFLAYAARKAYQLRARRKMRKCFGRTIGACFRVLTSFFDVITHDVRGDAETFLINELSRQRLRLPRKYAPLRYLMARSFLNEVSKHADSLRAKDPAAEEQVRSGVESQVLQWYSREFNTGTLRWLMFAVPFIAAVASFFPLVIYFYYPSLLNLRRSYFAVPGVVLLGLTFGLTYRDWRE